MARAYAENFAEIDFSKDLSMPAKVRQAPPRSDLPCPQVLSDAMDAVQSQVTGKFYESKSALRAEYKATGHIEKGNDKRPPWKMPRTSPAVIRDSVRKAAARVERGERNIHKGK
jgi:hypothetical protein